jgi:hypothetical protein
MGKKTVDDQANKVYKLAESIINNDYGKRAEFVALDFTTSGP